MRYLFCLLLLAGCDGAGHWGRDCYPNNTCDKDLVCVYTTKHNGWGETMSHSLCADPKTMNIDNMQAMQCAECPPIPDMGACGHPTWR